MLIQLRKQLHIPVIIAAFFVFFVSCKKNIDNTTIDSVTEIPDLTSKVNSSVSGFVTDENNVAVQFAEVKAGTATAVSTDKYGYFEIKDVELVKNAAFVTVTKTGYFKAIKTWAVTEGKSAFFTIKLLPRTSAGTIDATAGGNVTLSSAVVVSLPGNAVADATTNAAYSGNINVYATWLNPEANDLTETMPGDLRGIGNDGAMKALTTFGMVAVELVGDAGQLLQIANGKKATITLPLSSSLSAAAPSSVPLWYFNENNGLWKEEGSATKTGNTYVGEVSHFSYWNCDLPNATIPLTFTLVDANGHPLNNVHVEIEMTDSYSWAHTGGFTDETGYVSVFVTANTNYLLTVYAFCGSAPGYTQTISATTSPINLGNVVVPAGIFAIVSGTITDCHDDPVTRGAIIFYNGYSYTRKDVDHSGAYYFTTLICNGNLSGMLIAENTATQQESLPVTCSLNPGLNTISNIKACDVTFQEYINYTWDGVPGNFTRPLDSLSMEIWMQPNPDMILFSGSHLSGAPGGITFGVYQPGISSGSTQELSYFSIYYAPNNMFYQPVYVNITEYGNVGGYISGSFATNIKDNDTGIWHPVTVDFRIRRSQ